MTWRLGILVVVAWLGVGAVARADACLETPAPSHLVTSTYGWRFHPLYHRWRMHRGTDFRARLSPQGAGTTLIAAESGVVQVASSRSGGNELRIVNKDGTTVRYLHLTRALVSPGDHVTAGQDVAISGGTGEASAAPHLHFEVYEHGHDINPESMLCSPVSHKPGADEIDGFPILACNPDAGQSCPGAPPPGSVAGGAGAVAVDTAPPPAPVTSAWDDMSTIELLTSEVYKRFANPDWYRQTATRAPGSLWQDFLQMQALQNDIALRRHLAAERISQLWAVQTARQVKQGMRPRLKRQRGVVDRSTPDH